MQVTTAESIPYLGDILSAKTFLIKRISFVGETWATSFSRYPQMQEENPDKQKIITLLSRMFLSLLNKQIVPQLFTLAGSLNDKKGYL